MKNSEKDFMIQSDKLTQNHIEEGVDRLTGEFNAHLAFFRSGRDTVLGNDFCNERPGLRGTRREFGAKRAGS